MNVFFISDKYLYSMKWLKLKKYKEYEIIDNK